jgi:hypothetical protein
MQSTDVRKSAMFVVNPAFRVVNCLIGAARWRYMWMSGLLIN